MDPHFIELPRIVIVGNNVIKKLPDVCKELRVKGKAVVLADSTTRGIAGDSALDNLKASGIDAAIDLVADSTAAEVDRIGDEKGIGVVIGVGGGKVIDVAKTVAFRGNVPFVSVPTAPSHDGIASESASIIDHDGVKSSLKARSPIAILADVGILKSAPYRLIASGAADVISNLTAIMDWRLAHKSKDEYYSEYAASLALLSSEIVTKSAELIRKVDDRGIRNLIEALISSSISMSLAGSSRPASGAEHAFSHALDRLGAKSLHGEQCGLGSILMARYHGKDWKAIRDALKSVGAPVNAKDLGVDKEQILKAMLEARDIRERYTILHEKLIDRRSAEELCAATGVI
jgi:glycerol-1-phosphate dehydrogenase [NAD(P)+]